jgi:predicted nucleic acid-binding Zn ribbon protein
VMTTDELRTWMSALEEQLAQAFAVAKKPLPGASYVESCAPYRELRPCPLCSQPIDADSGLCPASCYHKRPHAYERRRLMLARKGRGSV